MNIPKNIFSSLTDKQKKLENVKTPKNLLDCAKEFGQELNQKQL